VLKKVKLFISGHVLVFFPSSRLYTDHHHHHRMGLINVISQQIKQKEIIMKNKKKTQSLGR